MASEGGVVDVQAIRAQIEDLYRGWGTIGVSRADWEAIWAAMDELRANEATIGGADKATLARKLRRRNAAFEAVRKERDRLREDLQRFCEAARTVIGNERRGYDIDLLGDALADAEMSLPAALTGPPEAHPPQEAT